MFTMCCTATQYSDTMKERDPLRYERLHELAINNPSPEALELLWEIKRPHGLLLEDKRDIELIRQEWVINWLGSPGIADGE